MWQTKNYEGNLIPKKTRPESLLYGSGGLRMSYSPPLPLLPSLLTSWLGENLFSVSFIIDHLVSCYLRLVLRKRCEARRKTDCMMDTRVRSFLGILCTVTLCQRLCCESGREKCLVTTRCHARGQGDVGVGGRTTMFASSGWREEDQAKYISS